VNTDHPLEEIGRQFEITRERIRQIETKALRKLSRVKQPEQPNEPPPTDLSKRIKPPRASDGCTIDQTGSRQVDWPLAPANDNEQDPAGPNA